MVELLDALVELVELRALAGEAHLLQEPVHPGPHHHLLPAELHVWILEVHGEEPLGRGHVPVARLEELGEELMEQQDHLGEQQVAPDGPALEELDELDEGVADLYEELVAEPGGDVVAQEDLDHGRLVDGGKGAPRLVPEEGI